MLALVHHLRISANIPLRDIVDRFVGLTKELVVEFIDRNDSMTMRLLAGRAANYEDYAKDNFESLLRQPFRIVRRQEILPTRTLYHVKASADDAFQNHTVNDHAKQL